MFRSCSPQRSWRRLADFQSGEGYGANIPATFVEIKSNCDADCHRLGSEGSKESMDGVDYGLKLDESPSQCFLDLYHRMYALCVGVHNR